MPLVVCQYKSGSGLESLAKSLAVQMPRIVANALDTSGLDGEAAHLTPNDIEVWCNGSGEFDVSTKDIEIIIWAHEFPGRKHILGECRDKILKDVRRFLADYDRNVSGFVWVLLQPTSFGEI